MIYLDNAATTRTDDRVIQAMLPYMGENYGNPSSAYGFASEARRAVRTARERVAGLINADPEEIYFTSGGTESDNLALIGIGRSFQASSREIITQQTEHPAVINCIPELESIGYRVKSVKPDSKGYIGAEMLADNISDSCVMVSVMAANNEIGTVNDLIGIGELCNSSNIIFHTDAVQAIGHIPIDVRAMHIDALSASGHKFHGPKGIGFLYLRHGLKCKTVLPGGGQERGLRSGTENVPGIVGVGMAAELARLHMEEDNQKIRNLRDRLVYRIMNEIPEVMLTGADNLKGGRLAGNASFAFKGIEGASLLIQLDMKGICASTGSACSASELGPSHVLKAIDVDGDYINGSLRLTLSKYTTREEIDYVADAVRDSVASLREIMK